MEVGTVSSITLIKKIKEGLDYCDIVINGIPYKLFGSYNENVQYLNKSVLYDTRPDIYEGKMIEVIANVVEKNVIQTVSESKGVKLIPDTKTMKGLCNYALDTLQFGDRVRDVVVYLSGYTVDSSPRAKWFDLQVVDMKSKVYNVRCFTKVGEAGRLEEQNAQGMVGKYVKLNMLALTKYGIQVEGTETVSAVEVMYDDVVLSPEVEVAISIINEMTAGDSMLLAYMEKYNYIEGLKGVIDIEPGFHLVRVATELLLIKALSNVTNIYSETTLIRAAICSRGYLIDRKNDFSRTVLNINRISRTTLVNDAVLIDCLDVMSSHTSPVKRVYIEVVKFANFIVDERRGLIDEKEIIRQNEIVSNSYGRLL